MSCRVLNEFNQTSGCGKPCAWSTPEAILELVNAYFHDARLPPLHTVLLT